MRTTATSRPAKLGNCGSSWYVTSPPNAPSGAASRFCFLVPVATTNARPDNRTPSTSTLQCLPTGAGWLFKIEVGDPAEVEQLLDEAAYGKLAT